MSKVIAIGGARRAPMATPSSVGKSKSTMAVVIGTMHAATTLASETVRVTTMTAIQVTMPAAAAAVSVGKYQAAPQRQ